MIARPSYGLAVPRLDAGIPRSISLSGTDRTKKPERTARIAEALLADGILRERDWCGSLMASINAGLSRWAGREMGADRWTLMRPLKVVYTDDMEACDVVGMEAEGWRSCFKGDDAEPVGFFSLVWGQHEAQGVQVRRQVLALERALPGFGFGLMRLLDAASGESVMVHSFGWAAELVMNWEEGFQEWDEDHPAEYESTLLTMKRFNDIVPEGAHSTSWDESLAREALAQTQRNSRKRRFGKVVRLALRLYDLLVESQTRFENADHLHFFGSNYSCTEPAHHPTLYTYWLNDEDDPMHRVIDQYYQDEMSMGSMTDITWMHAFQVGNPGTKMTSSRYLSDALRREMEGRVLDGSLHSAVCALRSAVQITGVLDQIFQWLDESSLPPELDKPPRRRRGRKLVDIYRDHPAAGPDQGAYLNDL